MNFKFSLNFQNIFKLTVIGIAVTAVSLLERQNGIRRDGNFLSQRSLQSQIVIRRTSGDGFVRFLRFVGDFTSSSTTEGVGASAVDRLTLSEANADVALESDVVARWEFKCIEVGHEGVGIGVVIPFTKNGRIRCATVLVGHDVLVLHILFHRLGNARSRKAAINSYEKNCYAHFLIRKT